MFEIGQNVIRATKSGWLISSEIIEATPKSVTVRARDTGSITKVKTSDSTQKLFTNAGEAKEWILG